MVRFIQTIGIAGFFVCLFMMYLTPHGVRGIREYSLSFQMPDMKFHYSIEQLTKTLEQIGAGGRSIYRNYLFLDFAFIFCFAVVMLTVSNAMFTGKAGSFMFIICIARALFDCLENSFLLLVLKKYPVVNQKIVVTCSCFTTVKFILLYIWIFIFVAQLAFLNISKINDK